MTPQKLSILGIGLGGAGFLLLFIFGTPSQLRFQQRTGGEGNLQLEEVDSRRRTLEKVFDALSWLGFVLTLAGVGLQFWALQ